MIPYCTRRTFLPAARTPTRTYLSACTARAPHLPLPAAHWSTPPPPLCPAHPTHTLRFLPLPHFICSTHLWELPATTLGAHTSKHYTATYLPPTWMGCTTARTGGHPPPSDFTAENLTLDLYTHTRRKEMVSCDIIFCICNGQGLFLDIFAFPRTLVLTTPVPLFRLVPPPLDLVFQPSQLLRTVLS